MGEYKYQKFVGTDVKLVEKKSVKATILETEWEQPCSGGQILSQINFIRPGSEQDGHQGQSWLEQGDSQVQDQSMGYVPNWGGSGRHRGKIPDFPQEEAANLLEWDHFPESLANW